jgi:hypothetical protein
MSSATSDTPASSFVLLAADWVQRTLDFGLEFKGQYPATPEPGSKADQEINHNLEGGPKGPWTAVDAWRPYDISGGILLMALAHYLVSLQLLLVPEMALYGFQVIGRSIIEGAAAASWVLDPDIDTRQRVIRAALLERDSIFEARKVEAAAGGDGSGYAQQILEFRTRMALMGVHEDVDRQGQLLGFEGKRLPQKTEAAGQLLKLLGLETGELWYRAISGVSHSILYGVTQYLSGKPILGTNRGIPVPELSVDAVANTVILSIEAYLFVVQRHAYLWGRDAAAVVGKRLEARASCCPRLAHIRE